MRPHVPAAGPATGAALDAARRWTPRPKTAEAELILAGAVEHLSRPDGSWAILDIGFANKRRTCGLLLPGEPPSCVTYGQARATLLAFLATATNPVNLVVEAPLSVAFSADGNPTGRSVESRGGQRRYWYVGLGCSVMVAALYLIRDLAEAKPSSPVRLFEGFVSFKASPSDHLADVAALHHVVLEPGSRPDCIVAPESLRVAATDVLTSAGRLCGVDFGVPPVMVATAA